MDLGGLRSLLVLTTVLFHLPGLTENHTTQSLGGRTQHHHLSDARVVGEQLGLRSKALSLFLIRMLSMWGATNYVHAKWVITLPGDSARHASHGPRPQGTHPPEGEKDTSTHVCLGAGEMEGPRELGGVAQKGFPEEASMGISKQLTTFFKINIVFIRFLTS